MRSFSQYLFVEQLSATQKRYVKDNWFMGRHAWLDPLFGTFPDRITLPFNEPDEEIHNYVRQRIMTVLMSYGMFQGSRATLKYKKGYVTDKHGRETSIAKVLTKLIKLNQKKSEPVRVTNLTDLLNDFNTDPDRQSAQKKKEIVFTRDAYDVAGMSTDRGWSSCMKLPSNPDSGPGNYWPRLADDLNGGTIVAYLVKAGDDGIKNPIARLAFKPYAKDSTVAGSSTEMALLPQKVYGTAPAAFEDQATEHVKKHLKVIKPNDTYNGWVNRGGYIDDGNDNNNDQAEEDDEARNEREYEAASEEVWGMDDSELADAVDVGQDHETGIDYTDLATHRVVHMLENDKENVIENFPKAMIAALLSDDAADAWWGQEDMAIVPDEEMEDELVVGLKSDIRRALWGHTVFERVVRNVVLSSDAIDELWDIKPPKPRYGYHGRAVTTQEQQMFIQKFLLLGNAGATSLNIERALLDVDVKVRALAAGHSKAESYNLTKALEDRDKNIRLLALKHPNIEQHHYEKAMKDSNWVVRNEAEKLLGKRRGPTLMGFRTHSTLPVHVKAYTTHDGTHVATHTRELPNMSTHVQRATRPTAANIRQWQYSNLRHRQNLGQE